ncbi:VPLPA-CTERM sorting domain-containing protein [Methylomonas methanica]|uniref:Secreted protein n=1 Tax=Methylomonas methanica (strain DSM 25384 / MC09) TaxID=857087 RepID=F9ZZ38_METMM|nr:VPLPA-CTERM sorting domain-containing protein [Methylomonas methanica]AEF99893.1 protein of unknown function DUF1555 [Methylomonas methanica MC09]
MKRLILGLLSSCVFIPFQHAQAHVSYYDIFNGPSTVSTSGSITTYSGSNITAGNYGWADATDFDWGDSHVGSWVKFNVTDPNGSYVNIRVSGDGIDRHINDDPSQRLIRKGDLTPGFSLYSGVVPDEAYDETTLVPGKEGAWRALGNTSMGNDFGEFNTINYISHAGEPDSLETTQSLSQFLAQGSYSLVIGGTCYLRENCGALQSFGADLIVRGYNIEVSISPTAPVPLPAAAWFMLTGLLGVFNLRKRRI